MKRKSKIDELVSNNPVLAIGITILVLGLVVLVGILAKKQFSPKTERKELVKVEFGDGKNSVVVEKNGRVTINTPYGTYVQYWDPEKIRKFFEGLENLDFEALSSYIGGDLAMALTVGGRVIEISINSPEIQTEVDELQTVLETVYKDEDLGDYNNYTGGEDQDGYLGNVDKDEGEDDNNIDSDQEEDNPWETGREIKDVDNFTCEEIDPETGRKIIISNTVCIN